MIDHGARLGIDVEVVQRDPGTKGFKAIPRRWVVERTFGRLMHHRRLARDYETHAHRPEAIGESGARQSLGARRQKCINGASHEHAGLLTSKLLGSLRGRAAQTPPAQRAREHSMADGPDVGAGPGFGG